MIVGKPTWTINLKVDKVEQLIAYKRKKEMDAEAEITEED